MPEVSRSWLNRVTLLDVPSESLEVPKGKDQRKSHPLNFPEMLWSEELPLSESELVLGFGVEAVGP